QEIYTLNDYGTKPFDLSSVLDLFNPISSTDEEFDTQFELAVVLATQVLIRLRAKYAGDAAAEREFTETYEKATDPRFV
ncbi:MYG1 family protein, partial [Rhodococcus erythropolis]|nr:MYG1 family protein [Rhodococcus erythropolis]